MCMYIKFNSSISSFIWFLAFILHPPYTHFLPPSSILCRCDGDEEAAMAMRRRCYGALCWLRCATETPTRPVPSPLSLFYWLPRLRNMCTWHWIFKPPHNIQKMYIRVVFCCVHHQLQQPKPTSSLQWHTRWRRRLVGTGGNQRMLDK